MSLSHYNEAVEIETPASIETVGHPWRRYFARHFDLSVYAIIWITLRLLVFRWFWQDNFLVNILESYIALGFMILIEPLLLSTLGTTPGKWILGFELRRTGGQKPTYVQGLERTLGIFSWGMGFGIPIFQLIRMWHCKGDVQEGKPMPWNENWNYRVKDTAPWRILVLILAYAILIFGLFWVAFESQLPVNRGDLTPTAYAENINDLLERPDTPEIGRRMTSTGEWVKYTGDSGPVIYIESRRLWPDHNLVVEDGIVRAVGLEIENDVEEGWQTTQRTQKQLMSMAFIGAQEDVSGFWLLTRSGLNSVLKTDDNYSAVIAGVRMTHELTYKGYQLVSGRLFPEEGKDQELDLSFWLEIEER